MGYLYRTSYRPIQKISPRLAIEHYVTDSLNVYASYGHSFNPPPLSQVYRYTDVVRANPNLDPERSDTFEVGMKKEWGTKTALNLSAFYVKTKDKVKYVTHYDKLYMANGAYKT
ncbi:MAG: TonB-dependent receptor [Veillonella sp.]|nr:TonB-dependent receptor [Veillonella sp.]